MLRSYKTEINPTSEQKRIIHNTLGVCRFIYNFYIAHNKEVYEKEQRFVSGMDFSKWVNNDFVINNPEYLWIKEVGSKAVKQSIMDAEKAFKRFFTGKSKFPRFKKRKSQVIKAYFPKNNKTDWIVERHRVKIPTLGFVRLKEKGYIPTDAVIKSGTFSYHAGRYYVSVLTEDEKDCAFKDLNEGIGIDLGIKDLAIVSSMEEPFKNVNKTRAVKQLEKQLNREQRRLSRKYESLKKQNKNDKGGATPQNIQKQIAKVQRIHKRLSNIRDNHINQTVSKIVKTKPSYIVIEDLNVRGMMKNRHLAKAVAQQRFYQFRAKLQWKCHLHGIELRVVDRFYPSSKLCCECGAIKSNLKLSDRVYVCSACGHRIDRDKNASVNLAQAKVYKLA